MTLLIAFLLLSILEAGFWAHIGVILLWLCHLSYHESK